MENKGTPFTQFDLSMMPITDNALICGNEFIISDNFDTVYDKDVAADFVNPMHPFKVNFTLFMFCLEGNMRINVNLGEANVKKNDMLVVFPGTIGESSEVSSDCRIILMAFTTPLGNEIGNLSYISLLRKYPLLHLSPDEMQEAESIYNMMRKKVMQQDYRFTHSVLLSCIQVLFCNACNHALRLQNSVSEQVESRVHTLFDKFIGLVQEHYGQEREIQYYAGLMCMTPKYLSRVVYQASGRYAGEWIRDYVILEAKALLKSGLYNVQQVSIKLNFASASFFGKYFKKAVGCSPRKYAIE